MICSRVAPRACAGDSAAHGLVSGIRNKTTRVARRATAAIPANPATRPRSCATTPESVVLSEAPIPDAVPTMPWARLNRPVPLVISATTRAVSTPRAAPLIPSSACRPRRSSGSLIKVKPSARIDKAANPRSSSGRRPQLCACRPAQGANSATTICGTMISAERISEEPGRAACTRSSPASGRTEALASWNRKRQTEKTSNLESCQRARRRVLGGSSVP